MNDADVSKQIQQMVRFIRQEAEEKANEISVSAEEVSLLTQMCTLFFLFGSFGARKLQENQRKEKKLKNQRNLNTGCCEVPNFLYWQVWLVGSC